MAKLQSPTTSDALMDADELDALGELVGVAVIYAVEDVIGEGEQLLS
jgi:hypothetical protein